MKRYMGWDIDFLSPPGEPAYARPDSVQWRVYKNPVALALGGVCAVLLEFADPRIRSGVWDHSVSPKDPLGRGHFGCPLERYCGAGTNPGNRPNLRTNDARRTGRRPGLVKRGQLIVSQHPQQGR